MTSKIDIEYTWIDKQVLVNLQNTFMRNYSSNFTPDARKLLQMHDGYSTRIANSKPEGKSKSSFLQIESSENQNNHTQFRPLL